MRKFTGRFDDIAGNPKPSAQLQVTLANQPTVLAQLFDENGAIVSNPLTTDSAGQFAFFVRSGTYDILDDTDTLVLSDIQIFDFTHPEEWLSLAGLGTIGQTVQNAVPSVVALQVIGADTQAAPLLALFSDPLAIQPVFAVMPNGQLRIGNDPVVTISYSTDGVNPTLALDNVARFYARRIMAGPGPGSFTESLYVQGDTQINGAVNVGGDLTVTGVVNIGEMEVDGFTSGFVVDGSVEATSFIGSGSAIVNINASNITSGTLGEGRLPATVARTNFPSTFGALQTFNAGAVARAPTAGNAAFSLIAAAGQTAPIQEWLSSSLATLALINASGGLSALGQAHVFGNNGPSGATVVQIGGTGATGNWSSQLILLAGDTSSVEGPIFMMRKGTAGSGVHYMQAISLTNEVKQYFRNNLHLADIATGADLAQVLSAATIVNGRTAMVLLIRREDGTTSLQAVKIGAANSGPGGAGRVLFVDN